MTIKFKAHVCSTGKAPCFEDSKSAIHSYGIAKATVACLHLAMQKIYLGDEKWRSRIPNKHVVLKDNA